MTKQTKKTLIIDAIGIAVFALFLFLDLYTKAWAAEAKPNFYLIPKLIRLTIYYNSGMAFSMFDDNRVAMMVIIAITVLVMAIIAFVFAKLKAERRFLKILLAIIEAGAVGNLVDRILWLSGAMPGVRDFVDVSFFGFGVCNLADFFVSFGGVILVVYMFFFTDDPVIPLFKKGKTEESVAEDGAATVAEKTENDLLEETAQESVEIKDAETKNDEERNG